MSCWWCVPQLPFSTPKVPAKRLANYSLPLHPDKTRIVGVGRRRTLTPMVQTKSIGWLRPPSNPGANSQGERIRSDKHTAATATLGDA